MESSEYKTSSEHMYKLGFCFLIYDIIQLEELWSTFFSNVNPQKYGIYIHFKENKPLKYFESYKLKDCIPTSYGRVSIVHAHNLLFRTAYNDGCFKIISLSQSCIPLKSFDHVYKYLTNDNNSHFNMFRRGPHIVFPRCNSLKTKYPEDCIQKSSNWFILNRECCNLVINVPYKTITEDFYQVDFPEEHYFITMMYYHKKLDQLTLHEVNEPNNFTTFTNWNSHNYKYPCASGLKEYGTISDEELSYLLYESSCLFGRKFLTECLQCLNNKKYLDFIQGNIITKSPEVNFYGL